MLTINYGYHFVAVSTLSMIPFSKNTHKKYVSLLQFDIAVFFVYASGIDTLRSPVTISILIGLVYKQSQQLDKQTLIYKLLKEH